MTIEVRNIVKKYGAFAALTGIINSHGRDLTHELMTGWLNIGQPPYIANFTIQSLRDIGFTVVDPSVVPEPATLVLLVPLAAAAGLWRVTRGDKRRHSSC